MKSSLLSFLVITIFSFSLFAGITIWEDKEQKSKLEISGYTQTRFEHINNDGNNEEQSYDEFTLNKARLGFQGNFTKWLTFKTEFDIWDFYAPMQPTEVYAGFPLSRHFYPKIGYVKTPVIYLNMMSGSKTLFADKPMIISGHIGKSGSTHSGQKMFPANNTGVVVEGDLFPFEGFDFGKYIKKGLVHYNVGVQNGDKTTGKNEEFMYSGRLSINPFGYNEIKDSCKYDDNPYFSIAVNYGTNIDAEVTPPKDATMWGFDGYAGWKGISLGGGWYVFRSKADSSKVDEYTEYPWQSEGFFIQAGAYIPIWKLKDTLQLKFRYEIYDPYAEVPSERPDHAEGKDAYEKYYDFFIPKTLNDRKSSKISMGFDFHISPLLGIKQNVKATFEYNIKNELEDFQDPSTGELKDTQIRDNNFIMQLQFAL